MKISKLYILGAALALSLAGALAASAAGYFTPGLPAVTAANIASTFQIPVDTEYAQGRAPQTAYVTAGSLKTYSNGGAIATGTASSGAATVAGERVVVTTEALTTAAGATYTLTLTNTSVAAASLVLCSVGLGSSTTGSPIMSTITPAAGSVVIKVMNNHASAAFNGTLTIGCRTSS